MEKKKRFCEMCFTRDRSFVAAAMHIDEQYLCLACIRAEQLNPEDGEAIPADEIPVVDARLARAIDKSRQAPAVKVQKESAPIEARGEEAMPRKNPGTEPAKCKCGKRLWARQVTLGVCKECREAGAPKKSAKTAPVAKTQSTPSAYKAKRERLARERVAEKLVSNEAVEAGSIAPDGRVTMAVSERFLEAAWARLTPGLKAVAIAAALEA
jgi:hypothetical protein